MGSFLLDTVFCGLGHRGVILAALHLPLEIVEAVDLYGVLSILLSKHYSGIGGLNASQLVSSKEVSRDIRDCTLSMYEGRGGAVGRKVFVGVMKYFRHILMGHGIFFKIFDGPRNIFLRSIVIILFFKWKGLKHKIFKQAIKEI